MDLHEMANYGMIPTYEEFRDGILKLIDEGKISRKDAALVIPELRESDDERRRKNCIYFLELQKRHHADTSEIDECIAYLEKQKDEAQKQFNLGVQAGREEVLYEMEKEQKPVDIDYISGIRDELLGIEDSAKDIDGLTESQWVAIRAAHRLLGEYIEKEQQPSTPEDIAAAYQMGLAKGRNEQKPAEWSKEEKGILLGCISALQNSSHWLLADKLSSLRPQPHWKPSKEQMKCLEDCVKKARDIYNVCNMYTSRYDAYPTLKSLYHDLKKLM